MLIINDYLLINKIAKNDNKYKLVSYYNNYDIPLVDTRIGLPKISQIKRLAFENWMEKYKQYVDQIYEYITSSLIYHDFNFITSYKSSFIIIYNKLARYIYNTSSNSHSNYNFFK